MPFNNFASVYRPAPFWQQYSRIFCKTLLIAVSLMVLFCLPVLCAPISQDSAQKIAQNFITYLGENHTIFTTKPLEQSDQTVGYVFHLSPNGYIVVASDTIRVPVKAYSLKTNFANLPPAYVDTILNELFIPEISLSRSASNDLPEKTNQSYWQFLRQDKIFSKKASKAYTPDTFLLSTTWNQNYSYNKLNPEESGTLTLTGCVQTAIAQVMRYHSHPSSGSGVFTHTWNGQTFTAVMNRPFNWTAMPSALNGIVPAYQQDEVAALMRDLGIMNQATFSTTSTSASFYYNEFERAMGYAPISTMTSSSSQFFTTLTNEIDNLRPVLLSMPGHMTVADGYASDGSGKKIHVNMGWGGSDDDYYYLDQTNQIGSYTFAPNHTIYYNLQPCQGSECNPYSLGSADDPPVISSTLDDIVIDSSTTLRIEAYDPNGYTVTLSASSSSQALQTSFSGNLLTLTPPSSDSYCQVTITAQSQGGSATKTFKVLSLDSLIYVGTQFDMGGTFSSRSETDEFSAYLSGTATISGDRGYSNQAFYIWVKDSDGSLVATATDSSITANFTAGVYSVFTSLTNAYTNSYYTYDTDYDTYSITVSNNSSSQAVSTLAASLGLELTGEIPSKVTLLSPSGTTQDTTPTFSWNEDDEATWYKLYLLNSTTGTKFVQWYEIEDNYSKWPDATCTGGTCSMTLDSAIENGSYLWYILGWNDSGNGEWSDSLNFTLQAVTNTPSKVTLVSPTGTITDTTPTLIWNEDSKATWYKIYLKNETTNEKIVQWYEIEDNYTNYPEATCTGGQCSVTIDSTLSAGTCNWYIRGWNDDGNGEWSDGMSFTVSP